MRGRLRRVRIRRSDLDTFIAETAFRMGPTEEEARAISAGSRRGQRCSGNCEQATALRQLATAATRVAGALHHGGSFRALAPP